MSQHVTRGEPSRRSSRRPSRSGSQRPSSAQTPAEIEAALKAAYAKYQNLKEGKNADYIPALAKVDPNIFGIALVTVDGKVYTMGDIKIGSVDPVDLEGLHHGAGHGGVGRRRDRQQHGRGCHRQVFNSIVAVEQYTGRAR